MNFEREGMRHEGFGADLETEELANTAEIDNELDNFDRDWRSPDNDDIFDDVLAKIRTQKDQEAILAELRRLDRELIDTQGEEDEINRILREYVSARKGEDIEDEDDSDMAMAA